MEQLEALTTHCDILERMVALTKYTPREPDGVSCSNLKCPHVFTFVEGDAYCHLNEGDECEPFYELKQIVADMDLSA